MPAKTEEQRKLFGMALSVRRGNTKRSDVSDNVLKIADGNMSTTELEKMASKNETLTIESVLKEAEDFLKEGENSDNNFVVVTFGSPAQGAPEEVIQAVGGWSTEEEAEKYLSTRPSYEKNHSEIMSSADYDEYVREPMYTNRLKKQVESKQSPKDVLKEADDFLKEDDKTDPYNTAEAKRKFGNELYRSIQSLKAKYKIDSPVVGAMLKTLANDFV